MAKTVFVFEDVIYGELRVLSHMTIRACPKCTVKFFGMPAEEFAQYELLYLVLPAVETKLGDWQEAS